jgi:hypothetical protein
VTANRGGVVKKGTKVKFTVNSLGVMEDINDYGFQPETVGTEDVGTYVGPHPKVEDWYVIAVNLGGRDMFVPCSEGMFEVA